MPSFGNRSLSRYEDKFFTRGIGRISFSALWHNSLKGLENALGPALPDIIRKSASVLAARIADRAPHRTGDLRRGIIVSHKPEKTSVYGRVVYDIYMDPRMNDTFVKYSKAGKRYYYPASQEYGFRIGRVRRKPGLYYMRDTAAEYSAEHFAAVSQGVDRILEEL